MSSLLRYKRCCVPNCVNFKSNNMVRYFMLPKNDKKRSEWLEVLNPALLKNVNTRLKYSVCELHFSNADYTNATKEHLNRNAVPFVLKCHKPLESEMGVKTSGVCQSADPTSQNDDTAESRCIEESRASSPAECSLEEHVEQSSGVDEQGMVDPTPESKEQSDNYKISENTAAFSGNCNSNSDQMPAAANSKILPSVMGHYLYTCPHCSERFECIGECFRHRKQCALVPAICDVCGKTVRNRCRLKIHRRQHNFVPVLCEKCGFELRTRGSVLHHKKKCLGRVKYFCEPCCKLFSLERTFKLHQKMHNQMKNLNLRTLFLESYSVNDREEYFICPVCDNPFGDKFSVIEHMNTENKSSCFQCGKSLQNERETFLHKCRKWTCCYCCAEFADSKVLRQHKLIHKSDEPFICKKCGRKFTSRMQFLRHKNFHYAKGFFQCEKCGKEFTQKYLYQDHMRKHEGLKWKCDYCDWSYFCRRALYKHIRKYHPGMINTGL